MNKLSRRERNIRQRALTEALEPRILLTLFNVNPGDSIQAAINAAGNGDTIHIAAGHYVEQIVIDGKAITLTGDGEGATFIDSPLTLAPSFSTTSATYKAVVTFANVSAGSILNLTIDGMSQGSGNSRFVGLAYRNAGGLVNHVEIKNMRDASLTASESGIGFFALADNGTARSLVVSSSAILNYQRTGLSLNGANLSASVSNTSVTGVGTTNVLAQNGMQLSFGASGSFTGNTISGNSYNGTENIRSTGILITQAAGITGVAENIIHHNQVGIYSDRPVQVLRNTIDNNGWGIELYSTQAGSAIANNYVTDSGSYGIYLDSTLSTSVPVTENYIVGNGQYGLVNLSAFTIGAAKNWWGSIQGPTRPGVTAGDALSPNVTFTPWLMNGTDADEDTPGFQPAQQVVGRFTFYNNSIFDGNTTGFSTTDADAIASDKQPLLPGGTATFLNYTSYSKGINGIIIDVLNLANPGALTAGDFTFKVGNSDSPAEWTAAPAPASIVVLAGQGPGGSDRIKIIWADGAIANQWLQVVLLSNANTGLPSDDVFYFGNAAGETGDDVSNARINAVDEISVRANNANLTLQTTEVAKANLYDFNRDRQVNAADEAVAAGNYTHFMNDLNLINLAPPVLPLLGNIVPTGPGGKMSYVSWPGVPSPGNVSPLMLNGEGDENAPVENASTTPTVLTAPVVLSTSHHEKTETNAKGKKHKPAVKVSKGKGHSKLGFFFTIQTPTTRVRPVSVVNPSSQRLQKLRLLAEQAAQNPEPEVTEES